MRKKIQYDKPKKQEDPEFTLVNLFKVYLRENATRVFHLNKISDSPLDYFLAQITDHNWFVDTDMISRYRWRNRACEVEYRMKLPQWMEVWMTSIHKHHQDTAGFGGMSQITGEEALILLRKAITTTTKKG